MKNPFSYHVGTSSFLSHTVDDDFDFMTEILSFGPCGLTFCVHGTGQTGIHIDPLEPGNPDDD